MIYEVWNEGYAATGGHGEAQYLGMHEGKDFKEACKNAINSGDHDVSYYDEKNNDYWGCKFFDNEMSARASFG